MEEPMRYDDKDFSSLLDDLVALDDLEAIDDIDIGEAMFDGGQIDMGYEVPVERFIYNEDAFKRLVQRVVPADLETFKVDLNIAVNTQHAFKGILQAYPATSQWREIIRYVHYICDPTGCRAHSEQNRGNFYNEQQKRTEPHYNIYKRLNTKLIKGDAEELNNVYEFSLILQTMEWMMRGADWMKVKAAGGAGKVTGIIALVSPIEPGNADDHQFVWDGQEMKRRGDIIKAMFTAKQTSSAAALSGPDAGAGTIAKTSKRTRKAKTATEPGASSDSPNSSSATSISSLVPPLAPRDASLPDAAPINELPASTGAGVFSIPAVVLGIASTPEAKMQWLAAASAGNLEVIRGMIQLSNDSSSNSTELPWALDVNWKDHRGMSALSKAAPSINYNANHTEIVRELLRAGADPAIQDVCGGFPLYYASCFGHLDTVRVLLDDPRTDLRSFQGHGTDALHIAANQGRLEVVELLLTQQHRLDIDHQMQDGRTALMGAITSQARFENRLPLVQRLLAAGINRHLRDSGGRTAFIIACLQGERAIAETIQNFQPTEEALQQDPAAEMPPPLELNDFTTLTEFRDALVHAALTGDLTELERLLQFSQQRPETAHWVNNPHQQGATTLMVLAQLGFAIPTNAVDIVHCLIHRGADPNIPNDAGQLPLMLAARAGLPNSLAIMQVLLEPGMADVNAPNPAGETALFLAARHGHVAAVHFLKDRMADGRTNHVGQTPSEAAYLAGHSQIAVLLFEWP